jgi:hypothetical protein
MKFTESHADENDCGWKPLFPKARMVVQSDIRRQGRLT